MPKFTDSAARPWTIRVTTGAIKQLREECSIDLADLRGDTLDRLAEDPVLLVDVLWSLCRGQAEARGVSALDFGEALVGDPIDDASRALVEAICDFFPSRRRTLLRRVTQKSAAVREKTDALVMAKIEDPALEKRLTEAMEARMTAELEAALTRFGSPTSSPASAASTLTAKPSES